MEYIKIGNLIDSYIANRTVDYSNLGNTSTPKINGPQVYSESWNIPQPKKSPETDLVEISTKKKSNKKKNILIGAGLTVLAIAIGVGVYAITKNKNALKLAEHIDFEPAKTIEEAQKF